MWNNRWTETTSNLLEAENLVVLQCVDRLLWKGYNPIHIELEPAWKLGHSAKGGYADVWVRTFKNNGFDGSNADKESLLIIECKTWGRKFNGAWIDTKEDGTQVNLNASHVLIVLLQNASKH